RLRFRWAGEYFSARNRSCRVHAGMNIAYLNDEYLPLEQARVPVLDRGFLFADGVYEVMPVYGGRLFRLAEHLARLDNSLAGIRLENPLSHEQWKSVLQRLVE